MGIGGSIFLIAIGAILTWAVHLNTGWLDLRVVGWVLMLAGVVGLVLTLWFWNSRRRRVVSPMVVENPAGIEERRHRVTPAVRETVPGEYDDGAGY